LESVSGGLKLPPHSGTIRVGTSGYQYPHWRGCFYPQDLPQKDWFEFYASRFDTVEINNTFYQLPSARIFDEWFRRAPAQFCYAVKLNRYITHLKRLKNTRAPLGKFVRRAKRLGDHLGPILVQLPPHWGANQERLGAFFKAASPDHRWCVEFRDRSWLTPSIYELLRQHDAALCLHDMIADHPQVLTATWTYLRFHGDRYHGTYSPQKLSAVARWIRDCAAGGRDVYVYFNNDAEGYAVRNAADLRRYAGGA
jgi:uncharacterized protein YecE (DUF72 family)